MAIISFRSLLSKQELCFRIIKKFKVIFLMRREGEEDRNRETVKDTNRETEIKRHMDHIERGTEICKHIERKRKTTETEAVRQHINKEMKR